MNINPQQPINDDLGNGIRLVEIPGDSFRIVESDGRTSVVIHATAKDADKPFQIRHWRSTQEIVDATGQLVAQTTDPEMARRICNLLIAHRNIEDQKAGDARK
jgi:hypothetical protein